MYFQYKEKERWYNTVYAAYCTVCKRNIPWETCKRGTFSDFSYFPTKNLHTLNHSRRLSRIQSRDTKSSPPLQSRPIQGRRACVTPSTTSRLKLACSSHGGSPIPYLSEENFLLARKKFSHAFSSLLFFRRRMVDYIVGRGQNKFHRISPLADGARWWKLSFPSSCAFEISLVITSSRIYGGKFIHIRVLKFPFSSVPCVSNSPLLSLNFQYGLSLRGEGAAKGVNIQLPGLPPPPTSVGRSVGGFRFLASSSFPCFAVGGREGRGEGHQSVEAKKRARFRRRREKAGLNGRVGNRFGVRSLNRKNRDRNTKKQ